MDQAIIDQIVNAESRALATNGPHGVNVVAVSVVDVIDQQIHLYNFFMGKTAENFTVDPQVALVCWKGLEGIQVKADATYITTGEAFTTATTIMKERFPKRTLSGIIVLKPTAIFDVSADATRAGQVLFQAI